MLAAELPAAASEPRNEPGDSAADFCPRNISEFMVSSLMTHTRPVSRGFTAFSEVFMQELGALVE